MTCPSYPDLPCDKTGVGYLAESMCGTGQIRLYKGHGAQFPVLKAGQYFYAELVSACNDCCEEVRVVATDGDVFTIERTEQRCNCFDPRSRLRYTNCSVRAIQAIARTAAPAAEWPIVYDCETHSYRLDCAGLHEMLDNPCGAKNETNAVSGGSPEATS